MTVKVWLHVRPAPGTQVPLVEALIPPGSFATHGHELGPGGDIVELSFQIIGEDREQAGEALVGQFSSSPIVAEAYVRQIRVRAKQRVRKKY